MRHCLFLFLFCVSTALHAQILTGRVTNEKGEKLEGAVIFIEGSQWATITDKGGNYTLEKLVSGSYTLSCSYLGYETQRKSIVFPDVNDLDFTMAGNVYQLDAVEIKSNIQKITPFNGGREVKKEELQAINHGQDIPILLQWQPSVTTTSDAGAGVGYTSMRIRGVEQSRINVTVNDIPVNDAESQGVFWVDLPDIASSTESVRIQRGVGPSTNGAGAYGGTVSLNTFGIDINPSVTADLSYGSFDTRKTTIRLNSGLMNNRFNVDARYSVIKSDGYIDRASADLKSWYIEGARVGSTSSLRLIAFSGSEVTYQAWNGVPQSVANNDAAGIMQHYLRNTGGLYQTSADSINLFTSGRRFNPFLYENQVDDYNQTHVQLHYAKTFHRGWRAKAALHYTAGKGYFEQFKQDDNLSNYKLLPIVVGNDTIQSSDVVRRRWLDNDFVGGIFKIEKDVLSQGMLSLGGGYHSYSGNHFGELISVAADSNYRFTMPYYQSQATKNDGNIYVRWEHRHAHGWAWSADAQLRSVNYRSNGIDNDLRPINFDVNYLFFNPKFSITKNTGHRSALTASFAVAHREPDRSDFTDHGKLTLPRAESLYDTELSWKLTTSQSIFEVTSYYMSYKDQLIPTGQLNDVGNTLRKNIDRSYRLGVELVGQFALNTKLNAGANLTLSKNKIENFTEVIYDYTQGLEEKKIEHGQTDISLSPGVVGAIFLTYSPIAPLRIEWTSKLTGKQYLDNTSNNDRSIPAYSTSHLNLIYNAKTGWAKKLTFKAQINNLFNSLYTSGGYTYSYIYEKTITENFVYPQAGIHGMIGLSIQL